MRMTVIVQCHPMTIVCVQGHPMTVRVIWLYKTIIWLFIYSLSVQGHPSTVHVQFTCTEPSYDCSCTGPSFDRLCTAWVHRAILRLFVFRVILWLLVYSLGSIMFESLKEKSFYSFSLKIFAKNFVMQWLIHRINVNILIDHPMISGF